MRLLTIVRRQLSRWISTAAILTSLCVACLPAQAQTLLVLGDSLSSAYGIDIEQGWVNLLQQRLQTNSQNYSVVNAGVTGDTTAGGLKRLPTLLQQHSPDIVIIELGGNDGLRGYPINKLRNNLQTMIELSREQGAEVLLLGIRIPPNYGRRYSEGFLSSYAKIARSTDTALVPVFMEGIDKDLNSMLPDGIHPNAESQPKLLENVWPYLEPLLRDNEG